MTLSQSYIFFNRRVSSLTRQNFTQSMMFFLIVLFKTETQLNYWRIKNDLFGLCYLVLYVFAYLNLFYLLGH